MVFRSLKIYLIISFMSFFDEFKSNKITDNHCNLASTLQYVFEDIVLKF